MAQVASLHYGLLLDPDAPKPDVFHALYSRMSAQQNCPAIECGGGVTNCNPNSHRFIASSYEVQSCEDVNEQLLETIQEDEEVTTEASDFRNPLDPVTRHDQRPDATAQRMSLLAHAQ